MRNLSTKPLAKINKLKPLKAILDSQDLRFIDEFLLDQDPEAAAERAGLERKEGRALLTEVPIRAALQVATRHRAERVHVEQDYVLKRWLTLLRADYRELSEHWRVACRHCYGTDHQYQFTDVELRAEQQRHVKNQLQRPERERVEFDDLGGAGYTINRDPLRGPDYVVFMNQLAQRQGVPGNHEANADHSCPQCYGHGVPHVMFHDTRNLSPGAALLYQGTKQSGNSYEILTRNHADVEQLVARHLGYFIERKAIVIADARQMSDAELEAALVDEFESVKLLTARAGATPFDLEVEAGEAAPGASK